jgi:hypothetical protein
MSQDTYNTTAARGREGRPRMEGKAISKMISGDKHKHKQASIRCDSNPRRQYRLGAAQSAWWFPY